LGRLAGVYMVSSAALFTAWETGKLPSDHAALLTGTRLRPQEIYAPEGNGVTWDGASREAVSDAYNTLSFATPLVELPIGRITPTEEQEYRRFRHYYTQLWRGFFDPIGMRF